MNVGEKIRGLMEYFRSEDFKITLILVKKSPLTVLGLALTIFLVLVAIFAPFIAPYDPIKQDLKNRLQPPSWEHPFGTDQLGRDIFSRVVWGSRISLFIALIVVAISFTVGTTIGIISGYFGGKVDEVLMRITDMFMAFPRLVLALAVAAALGPGLFNTMLAIAFVSWVYYARLARASTLQIREEVYIEAARAIGASDKRILFLHVLPMVIAPVVVQATLDMGGTILTAAGLGFLGLGVQPPTPEWGVMVSEGRRFITEQWWVSTFPGFAILLATLGFNLLGDGINDILNVRARR
ncbi:MAG: ABC transporter permease [Candidatus Korarchaeota archaeon]|nr:ABC transporter permease [Candidatus Korarchaeota archaeon]